MTQQGIKAHPSDHRDEISHYLEGDPKLDQTSSCPQPLSFAVHQSMQAIFFLKAIRRAQRDKWDEECKKAFQDLKKYLTSPSILPKPGATEDLYIYLAVLEVAISSIIIREELGARLLVFHSSKALIDATRNSTVQKLSSMLPEIQKLRLTIIVATRELKFYLQTQAVILMTHYSAQKALQRQTNTRRTHSKTSFVLVALKDSASG